MKKNGYRSKSGWQSTHWIAYQINFGRFGEDRKIHQGQRRFDSNKSRTDNIELHDLVQISRTVQCQSCLKHVPEDWFSAPVLRKKYTGSKQGFRLWWFLITLHEWITQEVKDTAKLNGKKTCGKQKMPKEEQPGTVTIPMPEWRKVSGISETSWMDTKIIADTCTASRRSTSSTAQLGPDGTRTKTPSWCYPTSDKQAGPMRARKDSKSTTQNLTVLRQEQRRQNVQIPREERVRQRPFDEALRADLEWHSPTHWSQTSFSPSSQQWWQHEHHDILCRGQHWWKGWWQTLTNVVHSTGSEDRTLRHTHIFLSVAHLGPSHALACGWRAWRLEFGMCCTFALLKSQQLTTGFHRPLLDVPDPFPSFCSAPPPSTTTSLLLAGIRRSSCATSCGGYSLAVSSNPLLSQVRSPRPASTSAVGTRPINYPSRETASAPTTTTSPPQS